MAQPVTAIVPQPLKWRMPCKDNVSGTRTHMQVAACVAALTIKALSIVFPQDRNIISLSQAFHRLTVTKLEYHSTRPVRYLIILFFSITLPCDALFTCRMSPQPPLVASNSWIGGNFCVNFLVTSSNSLHPLESNLLHDWDFKCSFLNLLSQSTPIMRPRGSFCARLKGESQFCPTKISHFAPTFLCIKEQ